MVFWPNFSQIGGYVFPKNGYLLRPNFGIFGPFFHFSGPFFTKKRQKCTKLNYLEAKSSKEMEKNGSEALLEILVPKHPKNHPRAK